MAQRRAAFGGHFLKQSFGAPDAAYPRAGAPMSQHALQMWVNRHLFLTAAWARLNPTSLAAIFILITSPIITRDYSNISERTHPHTRSDALIKV